MTGPDREQGAAVVAAVAMCALLVLVGAACAGAVGLVISQRRAAGAADLAALAGAAAGLRGQDPCAEAAVIAAEHGADVLGCDGRDGEVRVVVGVPALWGRIVRARARAGPAALAGRAD